LSGFTIIVDFRLKTGARRQFRRLIDQNAKQSATREPGCRRFDVLEPVGEEDRILLYEIYADRAAFDAHTKTEHYAQFDSESAGLLASKSVVVCDLVLEGSG
jgi:quinol monooxygenase YgiN